MSIAFSNYILLLTVYSITVFFGIFMVIHFFRKSIKSLSNPSTKTVKIINFASYIALSCALLFLTFTSHILLTNVRSIEMDEAEIVTLRSGPLNQGNRIPATDIKSLSIAPRHDGRAIKHLRIDTISGKTYKSIVSDTPAIEVYQNLAKMFSDHPGVTITIEETDN